MTLPGRSFLARFTRITTSGRFVPEIDGLRFVAITGVILVHTYGIFESKAALSPTQPWYDFVATRLFGLGYYGVHLFFMISGFILSLPFLESRDHAGPPVNLRRYYLRRLTRLEPPYLISMLLFYVAGCLVGRFEWREHFGNLVASLAYVHNLVFRGGSIINNNAWSLEVEIQFYILVPLLVVVFALRAPWRRPALVAAIVATSVLGWRLGEEHPRTLLSYLEFFLAGFLLSDVYLSHIRCRQRNSPRFDALAVLVTLAFAGSAFVTALRSLALLYLPWLFFVYAICVFQGRIVRALHTLPVITAIGGMCYSIYLLHARVISIPVTLVMPLVPQGASEALAIVVWFLVLLPLVVIVSSVFFLLIERPCMRSDWPARAWMWGRGLVGRRGVALTQTR